MFSSIFSYSNNIALLHFETNSNSNSNHHQIMNAAWSIHPKEWWSSQCDSTISWICMVPSTITLVFYIQLSPYSKSHLKKWPIQMMHCSTNPSYEQYLATFLGSSRSIHLCWSILTKSRTRGPKIVQLARSFSTIDKN